MKLFRTPTFARWLFFNRTWRGPDRSCVYLTFDDGPTPDLTESLLAVLKKYEVQATFFCVGENARKFPDLVEKIISDGHEIGNHTMRHERGTKVSKKEYLESLKNAADHIDSPLFRPPYGRLPMAFTKSIKRDFKIVMWTWLSYDFDKDTSVEKILGQARRIKGGDILVLHDNEKVSDRVLDILPDLIQLVRDKGLNFGVLSA